MIFFFNGVIDKFSRSKWTTVRKDHPKRLNGQQKVDQGETCETKQEANGSAVAASRITEFW